MPEFQFENAIPLLSGVIARRSRAALKIFRERENLPADGERYESLRNGVARFLMFTLSCPPIADHARASATLRAVAFLRIHIHAAGRPSPMG